MPSNSAFSLSRDTFASLDALRDVALQRWGATMIRLTLRGHDAHGVEFYSDEPTLDSVHKSLWGVLSVTLDDRVLVRLWDDQTPDRAISAFFLYRVKGVWCFQDGAPLKGPVLRVYWWVEAFDGVDTAGFMRETLSSAREKSKQLRSKKRTVTITRVTVRPKRAR